MMEGRLLCSVFKLKQAGCAGFVVAQSGRRIVRVLRSCDRILTHGPAAPLLVCIVRLRETSP